MTTLTLRVDKYMEWDGGPPPEVLARIYAIDPGTSGNRTSQVVRRELVPISNRPTDSRALSVDPGQYFVEVALPSGELLTDTIDVPDGGAADLVLRAEDSPHEWLSWQHLLGNVSPVALPAPELTILATRRSRSRTAKKKVTRVRSTKTAPQVDIAQTIFCLSAPLPALVGNGDVWEQLAGLTGSPDTLLQRLNSEQSPEPIPLYDRDPDRAVYRVILGPTSVSGATLLESVLPRHFVVVTQPRRLELLSLPIPWAQIRSDRQAVVEIIVQQTALPSEFVSSIGVRDEQLAVLLGFLSTGALSAVQEIAESAKDLLYGKMQNFLGAAAGAYAMVGTATDTHDREWHQWVRNLAQWFPQMPDGTIQLAQLLLRLRRSTADVTAATTLLKQAYSRGLPYYTLGVRWLLEGLERVGRLDPEAAQMGKAVRAVASRIHPQSPFTIIRLGDS